MSRLGLVGVFVQWGDRLSDPARGFRRIRSPPMGLLEENCLGYISGIV